MAPIPIPHQRRDENPVSPAHRIPRPFRWLVELFGLFSGELDFTCAFFFCLALVLIGLCVAGLLIPFFYIIVVITTGIAVVTPLLWVKCPIPSTLQRESHQRLYTNTVSSATAPSRGIPHSFNSVMCSSHTPTPRPRTPATCRPSILSSSSAQAATQPS